MTVPFTARRRAEEFDALVGRAAPAARPPGRDTGRPAGRDTERYADLLAVVAELRAVPPVRPRPEFTASLRERLMAEAETALVAGPARVRAEEARLVLPVRPRARDRRLATLLGGAALIGATTSMAVAAQTALPGDSLYPVKRAIEDARTGLAAEDADKGAQLLASARGRLDEADQLARTSSPTRGAAVAATLVDFDAQATEAADLLLAAYAETGDEETIRSLRTFTDESLDGLGALARTVPESARDEVEAAGTHLAQIDARAATACPACGGDAATLPPFLLSAATPGQDVGTVLLASSTSIIDRGRTVGPTVPMTLSGQDVGGIVVPELDTTTPGAGDPTAPGGSGAPTGTPTTPGVPGVPGPGGATVPGTGSVTDPVTKTATGTVDDVTKLLTGDVPTLVNEVPVVGPVVAPVVGDVVGGVGDTLDQTTGSLLD